MKMFLATVVILLAFGSDGCSKAPEVEKSEHRARADQYFGEKKFREALIEYQRVLRVDPEDAHTLRRMGAAHYELGELGVAYRYLYQAEQVSPGDSATRLKLGTIYLAGNRLDDARAQARLVLEKDPESFDGLILLAGASVSGEEVDEAYERLAKGAERFSKEPRYQLAVGMLRLRKGDIPAAEAAYEQAIALDPTSVEAQSALGNLKLVAGDTSGAEKQFRQAAELAPKGSSARVKLANFYVALGKRDEGKAILEAMTREAPDFLPGWRRLTELRLEENDVEAAEKATKAILEKNPSDVEGLVLQGRVDLRNRRPTEGIRRFRAALKLEPTYAPARYYLAISHVQAGNVQQAKSELAEALAAAPNYSDAVLLLARLNLQAGAVEPAIESLERFTQARPAEATGHVLLGAAYLAAKQPMEAETAYRRLLATAPRDPRGPFFVGQALLAQGNAAEAVAHFEKALEMAPTYVDALARLIAIDLSANQPARARKRLDDQLAKLPDSGRLYHLLGSFHLTRNETEEAEKAFLVAIEKEPGYLAPYLALGNFYARAGRFDDALRKLGNVTKTDSRNVGAHMLSGVIHQSRSAFEEAIAAYEKAVAADPRFGPAANNLAFLYATHRGDLDKGLEWAQTAKEVLPDDPRVADTLGWILYRKGLYEAAVGHLTDAVQGLPENADVVHHLGMAQYRLNKHEEAIDTLRRALELSDSFEGADEARKTLQELGV